MRPELRGVIERARAATTALRDAAREGRVIDFRRRDRLVLAIHDAIDCLELSAPCVELRTTDQAVIDCMGSEPVCAANGCQFNLTAGYRPGEGPVFQRAADGKLERAHTVRTGAPEWPDHYCDGTNIAVAADGRMYCAHCGWNDPSSAATD